MESDPKTQGQWELLPYHSEVLAVHAAVLPKGKVLFYAGSGNNPVRAESIDFGNVAKNFWTSVVWDPTIEPEAGNDNNFFHPDTLKDAKGSPIDFFCGNESFLADGRLLLAGGTLAYDQPNVHGFFGRADVMLFDPQTQQWTKKKNMAHGRWYPALVTLGDGRILAAAGVSEQSTHNTSLEIYSVQNDTWQALNVPPLNQFPGLPLYAHLFLLKDGRLFFTGGRMDDPSPVAPCQLDISKNPVQITQVLGLNNPASRNQSASVLLPPAQKQKVMILGGGSENSVDATASVDIVDFTVAKPAFKAVAPMKFPRIHLNAVLMPDHTVFVSGGARQREGGAFEDAVILQSEIYDPATNAWKLAAAATVPRLYHSIALLLPDGRVVAAGGNPARGKQVEWEPPDSNEELRMEVYSPPYLFKGPRPVIADAPTEWKYGQTLAIQSQQVGNIQWVSLIKNGVTTHSFNTGQRLVDLTIVSKSDGVIRASVTSEPNVAPPGWYMLFITDTNGVPSVAKWVHLAHA